MANNELQMPTAKKYKMPFKSITKRDGTLADFDGDKIYNAILRAGEITSEFDGDDAWLLTAQVMKILSHKFDESLPSVEDIQDVVEQVLISSNYFKTAKSYICIAIRETDCAATAKPLLTWKVQLTNIWRIWTGALKKMQIRGIPTAD